MKRTNKISPARRIFSLAACVFIVIGSTLPTEAAPKHMGYWKLTDIKECGFNQVHDGNSLGNYHTVISGGREGYKVDVEGINISGELTGKHLRAQVTSTQPKRTYLPYDLVEIDSVLNFEMDDDGYWMGGGLCGNMWFTAEGEKFSDDDPTPYSAVYSQFAHSVTGHTAKATDLVNAYLWEDNTKVENSITAIATMPGDYYRERTKRNKIYMVVSQSLKYCYNESYHGTDDLGIITLGTYLGGCKSAATTVYEYTWIGDKYIEDDPDVDPFALMVYKQAKSTPGEDEGSTIPSVIITGVLGAAAAAAAAGSGGGDDDPPSGESTEQQSGYKLYINKNFGDTLKKGQPQKPVFARIVEVKPDGSEIDRPDLTAELTVYSEDNSLDVADGGMSDIYRCAMVSVPDDSNEQEGVVSFRYKGIGGSFSEHVIFFLTEAKIVFTQENMGLPAKHGTGVRLPFGVSGMGEDVRVSAELIKFKMTDEAGNEKTFENDEYADKLAYTVEIISDEKTRGLYEAEFTEVLDNEYPAGTHEAYKLRITAETGVEGTENYEKKEADIPIYRIHLGLALTLEPIGIGCYLQMRPERVGVSNPTARDYEPCTTEGSLLLLEYDEEAKSLVRIAISPDMPNKETGSSGGTKVTVKRLENDRYAHSGDANQSHQELIDKLGITAYPTADIGSNGARRIKIAALTGSLDAPTRMVAELEIQATYNGKLYSVKKEVLLRSQPFRVANSTEEKMGFIKRDGEIRERLEHIQSLIWGNYMHRLFSLYNLIDRMMDGYDKRFGYDDNQIKNVMEIWTGFLEGRHLGANGTAEGVTFADELAAAYAFLEGMRDNGGILGRIALGVCTAGYSEYVFTAMELAEEIKARVYSCKGDEEFGFWDTVTLCSKEFGKQILTEYLILGVAKSANIYVGMATGADLGKVAETLGSKYTQAMKRADDWMKANSSLYRAGDNAMKDVKNYFNTLAKGAKAGIDETITSTEQAAAKAEQKIAKSKKNMTPQELKAVEEYDKAMEVGMEKVRKLKKAQDEVKAAVGEAKAAAEKKFKDAANEVWSDKNALKQLQRNEHSSAMELRKDFNNYREKLLDDVQLDAMDDIAKEWGIPRDEIYVSNATGGNVTDYTNGKKVPNDRDITFNRVVHSDRTKDFALSQDWGEKAVARNLYKRVNGVEPKSIEEALAFMKGKDVTYVCPQGAYYNNYYRSPNLEAYRDLEGMVGKRLPNGSLDKTPLKRELEGLAMNRATVKHKGMEWYREAEKNLRTAEQLEAKAGSLTGQAKADLLAQAQEYRFTAISQKVEGTRQMTKQFDNIIDARNGYRMGITGQNAISAQARELNELAKHVGVDITPTQFENILQNDFGLTFEGYTNIISKCLA